jgi:hypothetical protein
MNQFGLHISEFWRMPEPRGILNTPTVAQQHIYQLAHQGRSKICASFPVSTFH